MLTLIGMLDSPYVRRMAVTMELMGIPFEHRALSVFRNYDDIKAINPAVKVPTLVCDDGEVLMDSSLIIQWLEAKFPEKTLFSKEPEVFQQELKVIGVALAACEKAVQYFYEVNLRPEEKYHQPWLDRIKDQLNGNLAVLENMIGANIKALSDANNHASIAIATVWRFISESVNQAADVEQYPAIKTFSEKLEATDVFLKFPPVGPGAGNKD